MHEHLEDRLAESVEFRCGMFQCGRHSVG
jgi:hypothetical protein